jgi:hypothetical protein
MNEVQIVRHLEAARPVLVLVETVLNEVPRGSHVLYCRNYLQQGEEGESFKKVDGLRELFLPHRELQFKVVDFQQQAPPHYFTSSACRTLKGRMLIEASFGSHAIRLQGRILNESTSR